MRSQQLDYQVAPVVDDYFAQSDIEEESGAVDLSQTYHMDSPRPDTLQTVAPAAVAHAEIKGLSAEAIKRIYLYEDAPC